MYVVFDALFEVVEVTEIVICAGLGAFFKVVKVVAEAFIIVLVIIVIVLIGIVVALSFIYILNQRCSDGWSAGCGRTYLPDSSLAISTLSGVASLFLISAASVPGTSPC